MTIRKLLLAGVLLLGSVFTIGGLALTEAATQASSAGANTLQCSSLVAYQPVKTYFGINGTVDCGWNGNNTYTQKVTCVQVLSPAWGWITASIPGNPNVAACDTNDGFGYQVANANCYSGTFDYRTIYGGVYNPNGAGYLYTIPFTSGGPPDPITC